MHRSYRYSLFAMITLACSAIIATARSFVSVIERGAAFLWDLIPVELAHRDILTFEALPLGLVGHTPFDPALQQSLRHEAGVPRRAADRHT